ncbi:MAG: DUF2169 domain-containing protein [Pseudomonadota bacterium]
MKVFKDHQLSLLVKTFGLGDRLYLTTTVLVFFDLANPDQLLKEQDLWGAVPALIGPQTPLDLGMPKSRGEVLAAGKCFAPKSGPVPASRVSIRVGSMEKTLDVFGSRFWKTPLGVGSYISDPEPFAVMPLAWENAFGGPGFEPNPLGKGLAPAVLPNGETVIPLPNVEYPDNLIGAHTQSPPPAGFGPLDVTRPPRSKKSGKYDRKWLRERWPFFPDDLNFEFFNAAPEDQFLPGFFTLAESIRIVNMHPEHPVVESRLPRYRVRCFVTKLKSLKARDRNEEVFDEVQTHVDTVWLFPEIMRGLLMYRGTTPVLDDEFADIKRIFLAAEPLDEIPRRADYYFEAQKKAADLSLNMDLAPLEKARKKIADALKKVKAVPAEVDRIKRQAMGQAPKRVVDLDEMSAKSKMLVEDSLALLDRLEVQALDAKAKYGHLVRIPLEKLDAMRGKVKKIEGQVDQAVLKLKKAQAEGEDAKKSISENLKKNVSAENLAKAGVDPDNLLPAPTVNPWHDRGFPFVTACRRRLELDRELTRRLVSLGFFRRTITRAWLGFNATELVEKPESWGLKEAMPAIPPGLVIPRFDGPRLNRIVVQGGEFGRPDFEAVVSGSDETPLFLAAGEGAPVVRAADELQALFVFQEVGDACSVLALASPDEKPGDGAAQALESAPATLIILSREQAADQAAWASWKKAFPQAEKVILPEGNDVFQSHGTGRDLRELIMDALPRDIAAQNKIAPDLPEPGKPPQGSPLAGLALPNLDIKGLVLGAMAEITAHFQPLRESLEARQTEIMGQVRESIAKADLDPDQVLAKAMNPPERGYGEIGDEIAQKIRTEKDAIRARGVLTPEVDAKMEEAAAAASKLGHESEARSKQGLAQIAEGRAKLQDAKARAKAGQPPDNLREKLAAAGLDPDRIKKRTREEVIDFHGRGLSLSGAILAGVDLSGLDLEGINLSQAQLQKANLSGTNLSRADLNQAIAMGADFSGADLTGAILQRGLFMKGKFPGARLPGADLHQGIFKEADFSGADFSGARLDWVILQKAGLAGANLVGVQAEMGVFSEARAEGADFSRARLTKCLFQGTQLNLVKFHRTEFNSTMLTRVKGEQVSFLEANLDRVRIANGSWLPGADFRKASLRAACLRESDLSGALFDEAILDDAMLESCDLSRASFFKAVARGCRFNKSNLEGANLKAINLFQGSLKKARLVDADLRLSNLFAVDFYKAVVGRTQFDQANLKLTQLYHRTDLLK